MISTANKAIIAEECIVRENSIPAFYSAEALAKVVAFHVNTMRECVRVLATTRVFARAGSKEPGVGEVT
jgi:hypothetical protein